jgi:hypothetical protein
MAKSKAGGSIQKVTFGKKSHNGPKEQKPKRYRGQGR